MNKHESTDKHQHLTTTTRRQHEGSPGTARRRGYCTTPPCNYDRWQHGTTASPSTYKHITQRYHYDLLQQVFPWAKNFRAGIILIYKPPAMGASPTSLDKPRRKILKMLMVQQKAHKYWDNGKEKHIPERFGFPKGQWVPTDQNALVTAIRETHEETGINILDAQQYNVRIAIPTFIIPRAEFHIEEVLIYFIVTVEVKPPVCICKCELSGHKWVDMLSGLRGITPTTNPTAAILSQLENINFWGPINSISL